MCKLLCEVSEHLENSASYQQNNALASLDYQHCDRDENIRSNVQHQTASGASQIQEIVTERTTTSRTVNATNVVETLIGVLERWASRDPYTLGVVVAASSALARLTAAHVSFNSHRVSEACVRVMAGMVGLRGEVCCSHLATSVLLSGWKTLGALARKGALSVGEGFSWSLVEASISHRNDCVRLETLQTLLVILASCYKPRAGMPDIHGRPENLTSNGEWSVQARSKLTGSNPTTTSNGSVEKESRKVESFVWCDELWERSLLIAADCSRSAAERCAGVDILTQILPGRTDAEWRILEPLIATFPALPDASLGAACGLLLALLRTTRCEEVLETMVGSHGYVVEEVVRRCARKPQSRACYSLLTRIIKLSPCTAVEWLTDTTLAPALVRLVTADVRPGLSVGLFDQNRLERNATTTADIDCKCLAAVFELMSALIFACKGSEDRCDGEQSGNQAAATFISALNFSLKASEKFFCNISKYLLHRNKKLCQEFFDESLEVGASFEHSIPESDRKMCSNATASFLALFLESMTKQCSPRNESQDLEIIFQNSPLQVNIS